MSSNPNTDNKVRVAKITLYDGRVFHTDRLDHDYLRAFFDRVRAEANDVPVDAPPNQIDIIEMTPEEYRAIPATAESAALFGDGQQNG